MKMTKYEPGQFSWVDLMTRDTAAAKSFYGELFGWTSEDTPVDDCDAAVEKARLLGAKVLGGFTDIEAGRFCPIADPQGAASVLMKLAS